MGKGGLGIGDLRVMPIDIFCPSRYGLFIWPLGKARLLSGNGTVTTLAEQTAIAQDLFDACTCVDGFPIVFLSFA